MKENYRILRFLVSNAFFLILGIVIAWKKPMILEKMKHCISLYIKHRNVNRELWNNGYELITIKSSIDGVKQKAFFYQAKSIKKRPLIVSLHSWGGTYREYDSLALLSKKLDFNYLHPDFRGANNKPKACLSQFALGDIDDAIDYILKHWEVNRDKIFVVGKSGGGTAALGVYLKSKHKIHSVISWVPITDLEAWYNEGVVRKDDFVEDILRCTSSVDGKLNLKEARERSPVYWLESNVDNAESNLYIFTGVHDGIVGKVPISHSINFYNELVRKAGAQDSIYFVSSKEKLHLLTKRNVIFDYGSIKDRKIFMEKEYKKKKLIIFEGGHEILSKYTMELLSEF